MDSNCLQNNKILAQKYVVIDFLKNNTYLGRDKNSGSRVIIKKFSFGVSENNWSSFKQIENEIQILKRLNYPQIPKFLDSFQEDNSFYLIQEYIKGEELSTQKVYLEKEIIDIAKQILFILVYLQGLNFPVVHHDLKPENILLDKEGKVYLVDFGISKELTGKTIGLTTQFGGTNGFIAPEKILGKKSDIRSDLYSLGVTLACLITKTQSLKAVELLNDDFELKKGILLKSNCSLELSNWVQNLVQRKPENRFGNAQVALNKLDVLATSKNSPYIVPQADRVVLRSQDKKRTIEKKETKDIAIGFILATIIPIPYLLVFSAPVLPSINKCFLQVGEVTGCGISLQEIISEGIISYYSPWITINEILSSSINFLYNSGTYFLFILFTISCLIRINNILFSQEYYQFKYIFLRCLQFGYILSILFLLKTYLIGYFPITW